MTLEELYQVILDRKHTPRQDSYVASLLAGGGDAVLKKIGEEATEVVIAAGAHDREQLRYEAADLVYHLIVVLAREGLTLDDLAKELDARRK